MKRLITGTGVFWAISAWLLWIYLPHRSSDTALHSAMLLAPSYLLLSAWFPMRVFVITAFSILVLVGLRGISGNQDTVITYLFLPPGAALGAAVIRALGKNYTWKFSVTECPHCCESLWFTHHVCPFCKKEIEPSSRSDSGCGAVWNTAPHSKPAKSTSPGVKPVHRCLGCGEWLWFVGDICPYCRSNPLQRRDEQEELFSVPLNLPEHTEVEEVIQIAVHIEAKDRSLAMAVYNEIAHLFPENAVARDAARRRNELANHQEQTSARRPSEVRAAHQEALTLLPFENICPQCGESFWFAKESCPFCKAPVPTRSMSRLEARNRRTSRPGLRDPWTLVELGTFDSSRFNRVASLLDSAAIGGFGMDGASMLDMRISESDGGMFQMLVDPADLETARRLLADPSPVESACANQAQSPQPELHVEIIGRWMRNLKDDEFCAPQEVVGHMDPEVRERVALYLDFWPILRHVRHPSFCRFFCRSAPDPFSFADRCDEKCDGRWIWPADLSHYVRQHGVVLPVEFITHVLSSSSPREHRRRWEPVEDGATPRGSADFWTTWCKARRHPETLTRLHQLREWADACAELAYSEVVEDLRQRANQLFFVDRGLSRGVDRCRYPGCQEVVVERTWLCALHQLNRDLQRSTESCYRLTAPVINYLVAETPGRESVHQGFSGSP